MTTTPAVPVADDVESWLAHELQSQSERGIFWRSNVGARVTVHRFEGLAVAVSRLPRDESWGVCTWVDGPSRWGQSMRVPGGWIVEVHDGTVTDFAQRVFRGRPGEYLHKTSDRLLHHELWSAMGAAEVLWSWMHGALPEGCSRTLDYLDEQQRRRYGVR